MTVFDCRACGACCCNRDENRAEGYDLYVPVDDPRSRLLKVDDLRKRYVRIDPEEGPHLRLDPSGRCSALEGRLGQRVSCRVYADRPAACRRVQPGDADCLAARRERGIDR